MRWCCVLLLLGGGLAWSQTEEPGRIEGRVVSTDGSPVVKADVRLNRVGSAGGAPRVYTEVTDGEGRFRAEGIEPGTYSATAQRAGFLPSGRPTDPFSVWPGETRDGIEIRLTPLAIVSGIVTDEDGDVVPSVTVHILRPTLTAGRVILNRAFSGQTNELGEFRIANVQPGRYYLVAAPTFFPVDTSGVPVVRGESARQGNLATYYPRSRDFASATLLDVRDTSAQGLSIRMLRGPTFSVRGRVTGLPQAPDSIMRTGFEVQLADGTPAFTLPPVIYRRPDGFETTPLPAGDYTITVRFQNPNDPGRLYQGAAKVTLKDQDLDGVVLNIQGVQDITGRITIEGVADYGSFIMGMNAARNMAPSVNGVPPGPLIQLRPLVPVQNIGMPQTTVSPDGTFRIAGAAPAEFGLFVQNLPASVYVKSIALNGQYTTGETVDLRTVTGADPLTLDITLSAAVGSLALTPARITPATGLNMQFVAWPVASGVIRDEQRIRSSSFRIPPGATPPPQVTVGILPPGEYYVVAWEVAAAGLNPRDSRLLERLAPFALRTKVEAGKITTIAPKFVPPDVLEQIQKDLQY